MAPSKNAAGVKKTAPTKEKASKKKPAAAKAAAPAKAAEHAAAAVPSGADGAAPNREKLTSAKYASRPSPPFKAAAYAGETMQGNDGNLYESRCNVKGIYQWKKI